MTATAISAFGFSTGGVVAGSAAAGVQSSIGAVGAGSVFSFFQSLGALGEGILGTAVLPVAVAVGVGATGYCLYNEYNE